MVNTKEAAKQLGLSVIHVRLLCRTGKLPDAVKIGPPERGYWLIPQEAIVHYKALDVRPGPKRKEKDND